MRKWWVAFWGGSGAVVVAWALNTGYTEYRLSHPAQPVSATAGDSSPVAAVPTSATSMKPEKKTEERFYLYVEVHDEKFFVRDQEVSCSQIKDLIRSETKLRSGFVLDVYPYPESPVNRELADELRNQVSFLGMPYAAGIVHRRNILR